LALHVAMPLLAAESMVVGIGAGYMVGVYLLDIDATYLWYNMLKYTGNADVAIGLIKALVFGGIVAIISCYKGLYCGEGAEGVGRATTEAVVYSSITILITNFFLTLTLGQVLHAL
jgi:phospholipid/cholesterol/gamma-HCH transport system permease protein